MFKPTDTPHNASDADAVSASSLHRSMANWERELRKVCDQSDALMRPAAETLRRLITDFYARKADVLSRMTLLEGEQRAGQMRALGLDDMAPAELLRVLTLAGIGPGSGIPPLSQAEPCISDSRSHTDVMDYESTQERADTVRADRRPRTGTQTADGLSSTPAAMQQHLRRSHSQHVSATGKAPATRRTELAGRQPALSAFLAPKPPSSSQIILPDAVVPSALSTVSLAAPATIDVPNGCLQPRAPPISSWEVQGDEYIFRHHLLGPGWFVLRCDRGSDLRAVTFHAHPFHSRRAWSHFNAGACKYHDRGCTYTDKDLLANFARRVVDNNEEDVTDEWVLQSNEMIEEKKEKHKMPKSKPKRPVAGFPRHLWLGDAGVRRDEQSYCEKTDPKT